MHRAASNLLQNGLAVEGIMFARHRLPLLEAAGILTRMGFHKSTISLWLRGRSRPSKLALEKMYAARVMLDLSEVPFKGRQSPKTQRRRR